MGPNAVILGSAFGHGGLAELPLMPREVHTPFGPQTLWVGVAGDRDAVVCFRHGVPHRLLPNQINYRAQAWALRSLGVESLLITSSVGVLDPEVPVGRPMLIADVLMPDNRLPDGSACTMFVEPGEGQGHLVVQDGLFSTALHQQVRARAEALGVGLGPDVCFAYAGGPRTKTPAENRLFRSLGAQVNSMTVGPEVVLAAELEMPAAGLVAGHKRSGPAPGNPDHLTLEESLVGARQAMEALVMDFLVHAEPVPFGNTLYRFEPQDG